MKINKKSQNNYFGWHIKTHSLLTRSAIENYPKIKKFEKFFSLGAQAPDIFLKETSLLGHTAHNFLGKIDEFDTVDAYDLFTHNYSDALMFLRFRNSRFAAFRAGQALHFLQDMCVPLHTQKHKKGLFDIIKHVQYEKIAKSNPEYINSIKPLKFEKEIISPTDIFFKSYNKSAKMTHPFDIKEQEEKINSVKIALKNAYNITSEFLADFEAKFKRFS